MSLVHHLLFTIIKEICAIFEVMIMSYLTRITQQKVLTEMKTKYYVLKKQSLKLPGNGQLHSTVYPEILLHWVDCSSCRSTHESLYFSL